MRQLFISDLHLWDQTPHLEALFHQFMQQQAPDADELYILGDLFEAWIGDDAIDEMAERIINAFSHYSNNGGKLFFMHGNRDFLLGEDFLKLTGGQLLEEPHKLVIAGQEALLMHGDSLCTDDKEYIAFRDQVRNEQWQQQFLSQTIEQRKQVAREIRQGSIASNMKNMDEISDVSESEITKLMTEANITLLIHGHTHRQARHNLTINNLPAERIVLGDWGSTGSVLIADEGKLLLSNF